MFTTILIASAMVFLTSGVPVGISVGHICPIPMCAFPAFCDGPRTTSTFVFEGQECPGCPICTNPGTEAPIDKRQAHQICPVVDCFFPVNECSVPVLIGYIHINGHDCIGCPYCPTSTTAAVRN